MLCAELMVANQLTSVDAISLFVDYRFAWQGSKIDMHVPEHAGCVELRTRNCPPCSWTIVEHGQSPIPDPFKSFVGKKASKILAMFSDGMPTP